MPADIAGGFYETAFARHEGLFTKMERSRLRDSRVAIAGMGGVGGIHLVTLARMGVGKFRIADEDVFETVNINRQYGASLESLGRNKSEVMREIVLAINPELEIEAYRDGIHSGNIDEFLEGASVAIDGIDFFDVDAKRLLFNRARRQGAYVVTAGPMGFGSSLLVFSPRGMGFDEYFGISDNLSLPEKIAAFLVGLAPTAPYRTYMRFSRRNLEDRSGPSLGAACALCASLAATETARILLRRGDIQAAPHYFQFDPYRRIFRKGYLWLGGNNPFQILKRKYLLWKFARMGMNK